MFHFPHQKTRKPSNMFHMFFLRKNPPGSFLKLDGFVSSFVCVCVTSTSIGSDSGYVCMYTS